MMRRPRLQLLAAAAAATACLLLPSARAQRDDGCGRVLEAGAYSLFYNNGDFSGYQAFQAAACAHDWAEVRQDIGASG